MLIIHAISSPKITITMGIIFIIVGNISNLLLRHIIQLIILPEIIDMVPRSIVGKIILICSFTCINELQRFGPQRTISLNRTE